MSAGTRDADGGLTFDRVSYRSGEPDIDRPQIILARPAVCPEFFLETVSTRLVVSR